jgi:hypothetical protein
MLMMVDAAVSAAERLQASGDPQWHRVFTDTLQRLHQSKPRTYVLAADDPWIVALEQALGAMPGSDGRKVQRWTNLPAAMM